MLMILFPIDDVEVVASLQEEENMCGADGVLKADTTIEERSEIPNEHKTDAMMKVGE